MMQGNSNIIRCDLFHLSGITCLQNLSLRINYNMDIKLQILLNRTHITRLKIHTGKNVTVYRILFLEYLLYNNAAII